MAGGKVQLHRPRSKVAFLQVAGRLGDVEVPAAVQSDAGGSVSTAPVSAGWRSSPRLRRGSPELVAVSLWCR